MRRGNIFGSEAFAEADVSETSQFDERTPNCVNEAMFDEESPEAIGAFVKEGHREIRQHGGGLIGAASPDRFEREEAAIEPVITEV